MATGVLGYLLVHCARSNPDARGTRFIHAGAVNQRVSEGVALSSEDSSRTGGGRGLASDGACLSSLLLSVQ